MHSRVARARCHLPAYARSRNIGRWKCSWAESWVVDNESAKGQDMPCVLYPKDSSWSDAETVMYAKVASPEWEGVNAFVTTAIKEMKAKHGIPKEKIASGKTKDG